MSNTYIYNPKNDIKPNNKDIANKFFCLSGDEDFIDDQGNPRANSESNNKILAKIKHRDDKSIKYLIKLDNTKKLMNPLELDIEYQSIKNMHGIPSSNNIYKEVNFKTFEFYLMFLKTKNFSWLLNAEREDM